MNRVFQDLRNNQALAWCDPVQSTILVRYAVKKSFHCGAFSSLKRAGYGKIHGFTACLAEKNGPLKLARFLLINECHSCWR
ncbi:MAG: hypothetical protein WCY07_11385 [Pigmentiphaga sp.]